MRHDVQAAVPVRGERKARLNVVGGEVGKIVQHLGNGHAPAEIIEHIGHGDARAADAGLPAADARINGDALAVVHGGKLGFRAFRVKERGSSGAGTTANSYRSRTVSAPCGSSVSGGGSARRSVGQIWRWPSSLSGKQQELPLLRGIILRLQHLPGLLRGHGVDLAELLRREHRIRRERLAGENNKQSLDLTSWKKAAPSKTNAQPSRRDRTSAVIRSPLGVL